MNGENSIAIPNQFKGIQGVLLKYFFYLVLISLCIIIFIPLISVLLTSFKTLVEMGSGSPLSLPKSLNLSNYKTVLEEGHILTSFKNSLFLVVVSVLINTLVSSTAAYCITRFDFRFKKIVMALFVLGMMVPHYTTEIARFILIKDMGLYNTLFAPIVLYAAADLMQIYIFKQFIDTIPRSLDESAMIDGASYMGIFWRIIFPLVIPASATLAIIKAVYVINDMYIPYLYMPGVKHLTLTTMLMFFNDAQQGSWNVLSAAIVIVMVPTIIFYFIFQKYIFSGITAGASKE